MELGSRDGWDSDRPLCGLADLDFAIKGMLYAVGLAAVVWSVATLRKMRGE